MGDYRRTQQHGWITRTFDTAGGVVQSQVTIPVPECAEDRVVGVVWPTQHLADDRDTKFLTALLGYMGAEWKFMPDPPRNTPVCGLVYRVVIGKVAVDDWVDVSLGVLAGRVAYWPARDRVVMALPHPETMRRHKEHLSIWTQAVKAWGEVVRGERSALDLMARDCIKCAVDGAANLDVTEIDRNGFGLCRQHSGWDLRPEGQKWVQEKML